MQLHWTKKLAITLWLILQAIAVMVLSFIEVVLIFIKLPFKWSSDKLTLNIKRIKTKYHEPRANTPGSSE